MRFTGDGLVHDNGDDAIELAVRAPGQVAAQNVSGASAYRGAASGNANFDPASGRFAPKAQKGGAPGAPVNPVAVNPTGLPQGVTQDEWDRRTDAVTDAARSIETLDDVAVVNFLKGRVGNLDAVDVAAFQQSVIEQKMNDLTDILAQQLQTGRNPVSLKTSRSYATRVLGQLSAEQVQRLVSRLKARGFSDKQINKKVVKKLPDTMQKLLSGEEQ
jgi:hypothetical protein